MGAVGLPRRFMVEKEIHLWGRGPKVLQIHVGILENIDNRLKLSERKWNLGYRKELTLHVGCAGSTGSPLSLNRGNQKERNGFARK